MHKISSTSYEDLILVSMRHTWFWLMMFVSHVCVLFWLVTWSLKCFCLEEACEEVSICHQRLTLLPLLLTCHINNSVIVALMYLSSNYMMTCYLSCNFYPSCNLEHAHVWSSRFASTLMDQYGSPGSSLCRGGQRGWELPYQMDLRSRSHN